MDEAAMERFDLYLTENLGVELPKGFLYDFYIDTSRSMGDWARFEKIVPAFEYNRNRAYFDMVVPTINTVRFSKIMSQQMKAGR
ncbi:MAG: hypothetical protein V2I33_21835 [Kangiellaceae bacterium]|nr:hypothetical protein [Kangiellaceae bacterium]